MFWVRDGGAMSRSGSCGGLVDSKWVWVLEIFWVWLGARNFLGLVGYGFAEYVGKFGFEWWF